MKIVWNNEGSSFFFKSLINVDPYIIRIYSPEVSEKMDITNILHNFSKYKRQMPLYYLQKVFDQLLLINLHTNNSFFRNVLSKRFWDLKSEISSTLLDHLTNLGISV